MIDEDLAILQMALMGKESLTDALIEVAKAKAEIAEQRKNLKIAKTPDKPASAEKFLSKRARRRRRRSA